MRSFFPAIAVVLISCSLFPAALAAPQVTVIHAETRLVEVNATVEDSHGHYVDDLPSEAFELYENGMPQKIKYFETNMDVLHCAILLDTTGSMFAALPRLKNSVVEFVDALGPKDDVAIFTFDQQVTLRQDFTTDKAALKRATLKLHANGGTALYDALSEVTEAVSRQSGKKAILLFSDGDDNASVLNAQAAVNRAKKLGIPLFTIAEGEATNSPKLKDILTDLSKSTGGATFQIKNPEKMEEVFLKISEELRHMYLLTYDPPDQPADGKWRKIEVKVASLKEPRIRARDGYYAAR